ncbi:diguanylate cyclase (GGDEF) domain-containing protein [Massilia sp. PDC64]|nr:diguanylate cyclase [Massilia sp. PDC64]SDD35263.1 diguanylate cyclase (GGDEF) domain-containing protein [Massilia sp. PDC64]
MLITDTLPARPPAGSSGTGLRWLAAVMLAILAGLAVLPFLASRAADATMDALQTVVDKERAYDRLLDLLTDAETGQRGYVITGDAGFLDPYHASVAAIPAAVRDLKPLADGLAEQATLDEIERLAQRKVDELATTIRLRRDEGFAPAAAVVSNRGGKADMDRLRLLIRERVAALERERLALRDRLSRTLGYNTVLGICAGVASALVIGCALFLVTRSLRAGKEAADHARQLADAQADHARQSQARSQRLAVTAQMLQAMDSLTRTDELHSVLPAFLPKVLPGSSGAVYLYRNSRDYLQRAAVWDGGASHPELVNPAECWGLRFGHAHAAQAGDDMHCPHLGTDQPAPGRTDLCVPMISQGEVLGLLSVSVPHGPDTAVELAAATTISEQLAIGISNINLREVLRRQSTVDELTGLYNRRYFDETLRRELFRAERMRASLAVVMIDLDHFKHMNDTYGHEAGDLVLRTVGRCLREGVRRSDIACRYGGEELVLVLPECDAAAARTCAETLRKTISALQLHHADAALPQVTASFGIALWPAHGEDAHTLVHAADRALYDAKHGGRNRVCMAS